MKMVKILYSLKLHGNYGVFMCPKCSEFYSIFSQEYISSITYLQYLNGNGNSSCTLSTLVLFMQDMTAWRLDDIFIKWNF